MLQVESGLML